MPEDLIISNYLNDVFQDWQDSRDAFPENIIDGHYWPVPFFGNPATALVATIGVNPSSGEFVPGRHWDEVLTQKDWKLRLKNYFKPPIGPHKWFDPWTAGLALLDCSYKEGTAAHFDVSYRPTKAMLRNKTTDHREFRHMVERDVAWLFRLLHLCSNLRGLLVFGPVVQFDGTTEILAGFIRKNAPRHGFSVLPTGGLCASKLGKSERSFFLQEVWASGRGTITDQVVENLRLHRDELRGLIAGRA